MASGHNVGQNNEMASDIKTSFQWFKASTGYLLGAGLYVSATVVTDMAGNTLTGWSPGAIFIDTTNARTYSNKGATVGTTDWTVVC